MLVDNSNDASVDGANRSQIHKNKTQLTGSSAKSEEKFTYTESNNSSNDHYEPRVRLINIPKSPRGSCGFNLTRTKWDPYPWVSSVQATTAADRSGLKAGDCLLEVNGEDVLGLHIADIAKLMQMKPESEVTLLVWTSGWSPACDPESLCCGPMPSSFQRLSVIMQHILSVIECPVCLDTIRPPAMQCQNGHLLCVNCRIRAERCPICRDRYTPRRALIAEEIYTAITKAFNLCRNEDKLREKLYGVKKIQLERTWTGDGSNPKRETESSEGVNNANDGQKMKSADDNRKFLRKFFPTKSSTSVQNIPMSSICSPDSVFLSGQDSTRNHLTSVDSINDSPVGEMSQSANPSSNFSLSSHDLWQQSSDHPEQYIPHTDSSSPPPWLMVEKQSSQPAAGKVESQFSPIIGKQHSKLQPERDTQHDQSAGGTLTSSSPSYGKRRPLSAGLQARTGASCVWDAPKSILILPSAAETPTSCELSSTSSSSSSSSPSPSSSGVCSTMDGMSLCSSSSLATSLSLSSLSAASATAFAFAFASLAATPQSTGNNDKLLLSEETAIEPQKDNEIRPESSSPAPAKGLQSFSSSSLNPSLAVVDSCSPSPVAGCNKTTLPAPVVVVVAVDSRLLAEDMTLDLSTRTTTTLPPSFKSSNTNADPSRPQSSDSYSRGESEGKEDKANDDEGDRAGGHSKRKLGCRCPCNYPKDLNESSQLQQLHKYRVPILSIGDPLTGPQLLLPKNSDEVILPRKQRGIEEKTGDPLLRGQRIRTDEADDEDDGSNDKTVKSDDNSDSQECWIRLKRTPDSLSFVPQHGARPVEQSSTSRTDVAPHQLGDDCVLEIRLSGRYKNENDVIMEATAPAEGALNTQPPGAPCRTLHIKCNNANISN